MMVVKCRQRTIPAVYRGKTPEQVVQQLKSDAYASDKSNWDYMREVQKRAIIYKRKPIFFSNEETFLKEMVRLGEIEIERWMGDVQ